MFIIFVVGIGVGDCLGFERSIRRFDNEACKLVCERHTAGKVHSVDQTYCVCEFGRTFKRDRSRLYVRAEAKR